MTLSRLLTFTAAYGLLVLLGGCSTPTNYVVVPEEEPAAAPAHKPAGHRPERYTVKPGDSLYLISFATGTDWRELARLNGITPPYRIYPGQSLLVRAGRADTGAVPRVAQPAAPPASALPLPLPAPATSAAPVPRAAASAGRSTAAPPVRVQPPPAQTVQAAVPPPAPSARTVAPAAAPQKPVAVAPSTLRPPKPGAWQWPAAGKVIGRFSGGAQPHKGIDLDGRAGDPVRAANSGVVVYAGSGVRGYGNLLIVKHDDVFLSAYAHNSKLLVKEGDVVRAGQTIAEIGDSGTDRVKLHFEVRRKGSPVDPAKVLPRR